MTEYPIQYIIRFAFISIITLPYNMYLQIL